MAMAIAGYILNVLVHDKHLWAQDSRSKPADANAMIINRIRIGMVEVTVAQTFEREQAQLCHGMHISGCALSPRDSLMQSRNEEARHAFVTCCISNHQVDCLRNT